MLLGLIGIVVSLLLLILLAYRGVPVIIAAPVSALVALIFSGAPLLASYTEIFMPALAGFISNYFPLFLTGAIFGGLMSASGYARSIAQSITRVISPRHAIAATVVTSAVLTYGGISVFVVVFVMFPLAIELFRAADISRRLIPATIGLGILTFTMTALPGTPQVQNIIPGATFQTNTFAAPGIGLIGAVIIFGLGMTWLEYRKRKLLSNGENFSTPTLLEHRASSRDVATTAGGSSTNGAASSTTTVMSTTSTTSPGEVSTLTPPNAWMPFIPLLLVFAVNFGCTLFLFPAMEWGYLSDDLFRNITLDDRTAIWAVLVAVLAAIVSILLLNLRQVRLLWTTFVDGAKNALMPIFSTASEVGYGAVIASVAAFAVVRDGLLGISGNALIASTLSTTTIAAITGSASGGMSIALNALGSDLREMAIDQGISMEAMHRITAMASGGLDTLPHNGAIITLLLVCGMSHRESYKDVGVISIGAPVIAIAVLIPVVMIFGTF